MKNAKDSLYFIRHDDEIKCGLTPKDCCTPASRCSPYYYMHTRTAGHVHIAYVYLFVLVYLHDTTSKPLSTGTIQIFTGENIYYIMFYCRACADRYTRRAIYSCERLSDTVQKRTYFAVQIDRYYYIIRFHSRSRDTICVVQLFRV